MGIAFPKCSDAIASGAGKPGASRTAASTDFVRSFLERDFGTLGLGATPASLGRLWRMAAHHHGQFLNASELGRSLGETHKTVQRHPEILKTAFMVRLLQPWFANLGKRLVRRPKLFVRDSGLLHALLGIPDETALLSRPTLGSSWKGFAMEQLLARLPPGECFFWAAMDDGCGGILFEQHVDEQRIDRRVCLPLLVLIGAAG